MRCLLVLMLLWRLGHEDLNKTKHKHIHETRKQLQLLLAMTSIKNKTCCEFSKLSNIAFVIFILGFCM